jgi:metal-responsive CopG/Arc/MetJ family transcriptional regulator
MRVRTNLIIEESLLKKIDAIAGDKNKRAAVIETALREFIAREEVKEAANPKTEAAGEKTPSRTSGARV